MSNITPKTIEKIIYIIRDQKVMLDSDLAELYGVEVRTLNQAVKRNPKRFPSDFVFQITKSERDSLRSQFVTFKESTARRKYLPYVFSENGIAMLSSVLSSEKAIMVNVSIMRTFTKMRALLASDESMLERLIALESDRKRVNKIFKLIFDKLQVLERDLPSLSSKRKKIGLSPKDRK